MSVDSGVIIAWDSTVASIPANWTRKTEMDGLYIRGALASGDGGAFTGQSTHDHTESGTHNSIQSTHHHLFSAGAGAGAAGRITTGTDFSAIIVHTHGSTANPTTVATNVAMAITINATSNDLAYVAVIWIESNGSPNGFPNGSLCYLDTDTIPASWSRSYGARYMKGAPPAGDGGGTGGTNTHTHVSPEHTHLQNSHTHTTTTSAIANNGLDTSKEGGSGTTTAASDHTHEVFFSGTTGTNQGVTSVISTEDGQPPFSTLNCIKNGTGGEHIKAGMIALWYGTDAEVTALTDWDRLTALDTLYCKNANADTEVGNTGGALTHGHTTDNCQPVVDLHDHTADTSDISATDNVPNGPGEWSDDGHSHTWTTGNPTVAVTNTSVAITINDSSSGASSPYGKRLIFMEYTGAEYVPGGDAVLDPIQVGVIAFER